MGVFVLVGIIVVGAIVAYNHFLAPVEPMAPSEVGNQTLDINEYGSRAIAAYKGTPVFEVISAPSGRTTLKGEAVDDHVIVQFESCTGSKEECDNFSESAQKNLDQLRGLLLQNRSNATLALNGTGG